MGEIAIAPGGALRIYASPSVKRHARQLGVELAAVEGSGRGGRVLLQDVHTTIRSRMMELQAGHTRAVTPVIPTARAIDYSKYGAVESQPLSTLQRLAGGALTLSRTEIPHVTNFEEVDVTDLEGLRGAINNQGRAVEVSLLSFVVCACAAALKAMPVFNASLDGANIVLKKYINIGISVDTPDGATVPVIRNVDQSGVLQIAARLAERVAAARAGELSADDVEGRSFTICASGSGGGTGFTPIINAPDVAILGLAAVHIQPRWQDEKIVPRSILRLCLSWDHRVLDGVAAARFLVCVGESLSALGRLQL